MWVIVAVVVLVVLVATYVTWTATRVDRLHARAAAAFSALDAQSIRRAAATAELGRDTELVEAQRAAKAVLTAHPDDRETAENDLTRTLRTVSGKVAAPGFVGVVEASRRLALARQVHSDLVRDALAVRRRPLVRMLRLSRRHSLPRFFDIDDPNVDIAIPQARRVDSVMPRPATSPDSVMPRPATSPDSVMPRPATSPDSVMPRPATSPDSVMPRPATSPDSVMPRPATSPDSVTPRPATPAG